MHGLINRAIQRFAEETLGPPVWREVLDEVAPGLDGFEAMLTYDDALTEAVLAALCARTGTPREMLLEDVGTFLVSHPTTEALRRLLRFGGEGYADFLLSLDDLPDRARLAVPDLDLPPIEVTEAGPGHYRLAVAGGWPGLVPVLLGLLRAMADDYGALALVSVEATDATGARLDVRVAEAAFSEGRRFELARRAGG